MEIKSAREAKNYFLTWNYKDNYILNTVSVPVDEYFCNCEYCCFHTSTKEESWLCKKFSKMIFCPLPDNKYFTEKPGIDRLLDELEK